MFLLVMLLPCLLMLSTVASAIPPINERPIIGIVSVGVYESEKSYIAASYVKFLESAGARVVPVLSNSTDDELVKLFGYLNGVLIPGGGASLITSHYSHASGLFIELAKKAYDAGDYFPVWGICLGFELMNVLQGGDNMSIITSFDAENVSLNLKFNQAAASSRLYSSFSSDLIDRLQTDRLTFNNHKRGITMDTYSSTPKLGSFYNVLSTSVDREGKEFISSIEGKRYPFYAVQFHLEKAGFEWSTKEAINHSEHSVMVMQAAANFLVSEARKSSHKFPSTAEESSYLIYNYTPTYTGNSSMFLQKYYF